VKVLIDSTKKAISSQELRIAFREFDGVYTIARIDQIKKRKLESSKNSYLE
jgi:hypothetical protein